jgi:hypothetical protein
MAAAQGKPLLAIILLCLTLWIDKARAFEVTLVNWNGQEAALIEGEIVSGDAQRVSKVLDLLPNYPHGAAVMLLNSVGGLVEEALQISELFDKRIVHTVVPKGARCASACASILFIAGQYRTVEEGGLLGQHSCAVNGVRNEECNTMLAQNAVVHGVSYGSISAFVTYVAPRDILWFSRKDSDCYGITRYPFTDESGFDKSEPCVIRVITGAKPRAQSAWRVDFKENGYQAFVRPLSDEDREGELDIFCDNKRLDTLFVSMNLGGPATTIRQAIKSASLEASPISYGVAPYIVTQIDDKFTQVTIELQSADVRRFLRDSNEISFSLSLLPPYHDIYVKSYLAGSRRALLFVANHCLDDRIH